MATVGLQEDAADTGRIAPKQGDHKDGGGAGLLRALTPERKSLLHRPLLSAPRWRNRIIL